MADCDKARWWLRWDCTNALRVRTCIYVELRDGQRPATLRLTAARRAWAHGRPRSSGTASFSTTWTLSSVRLPWPRRSSSATSGAVARACVPRCRQAAPGVCD
jgi:hypothetical protein